MPDAEGPLTISIRNLGRSMHQKLAILHALYFSMLLVPVFKSHLLSILALQVHIATQDAPTVWRLHVDETSEEK